MPLPDVEITFSVTADTVSWYGAIVATLALLVSIHNVWRDRPRIFLGFGKNYRRPEEWEKPLFYVSVTNRGRRPVRIDKAWVKVYGYSGEALLADSLNTAQERTLDERNPKITFWTEEGSLNAKNIYCIFASDETGRIYKKYVKTFPSVGILYWMLKTKLFQK